MRTTQLFTLVVAGTLVMGLTLPAQTPPPPPGGQGAAGPAAGRGRGDGRGGPQRDDPANVGVDYSKRNPVRSDRAPGRSPVDAPFTAPTPVITPTLAACVMFT